MYSRSVKDVWLTSGRARIKFNSSCLGVGSILAISEFEMVVPDKIALFSLVKFCGTQISEEVGPICISELVNVSNDTLVVYHFK